MPTLPKKVAARLAKEIGTFQRVLQAAKDRDVNESDTVTIVTDMLAAVYGFDKYTDLTSEQAIRGTFCDLAVKLEGSIKFLIEVKAVGLDLKDNHLRQAVNYGANHGIEWVVLTNGVEWQIHRLRFERPVNSELVCSLNFLGLRPRAEEDQSKLFLLCKEGFQKAAIEEYHAHSQSVNRFMIGAIVLDDSVLAVVRRELRRLTPGLQVDTEEVKNILFSDVLKRDVVVGEMAERAQARVKKAAKRVLRKRRKSTDVGGGDEVADDEEGTNGGEDE